MLSTDPEGQTQAERVYENEQQYFLVFEIAESVERGSGKFIPRLAADNFGHRIPNVLITLNQPLTATIDCSVDAERSSARQLCVDLVVTPFLSQPRVSLLGATTSGSQFASDDNSLPLLAFGLCNRNGVLDTAGNIRQYIGLLNVNTPSTSSGCKFTSECSTTTLRGTWYLCITRTIRL